MKFVFVTDNHFHLFSNYSVPDDEFVNDRFREQMEALQKVFDIARENNARLIFGGDLFHKRNSVDTRVFNHVFKVFANNQDIHVYLVRGNHDAVTNSLYTDSSIDIFDTLPNLEVTKSLRSEPLSDKVQLTMCAYGDETEEIKKSIKNAYQEGKVNILVAHLGVEGSLTGKGSHRLEGAFGYQDLLPDKYDFILLGHYHRRQYFNNTNHFYGGSMMQQSFSDEQEDNGVHLIDTDKMTTEFISLGTRKFITLKGDNLPDNYNDIIESNNFIRFIGNEQHAKALSLDNELKDKNIEVQIKKDYTVEKRIDSEPSDDPISVASSYADRYYPDSKKEIVECLKEVI